MSESIEILERLIAFPTVSRDSNLGLIRYVEGELAALGVASRLVFSADGAKANLFATIGPAGIPGIMLSGHTDVVPVDGQAWSSDPFRLHRQDGLLFGRGSADMKGFIACVLTLARRAARETLSTPLHIALSHDEEIGCVGVRRLIEMMAGLPVRPRACVVGEPTSMQVVVAHKGKTALRAHCHGVECHSSLAPDGLNAIHLATDLIAALRRLQDDIALTGAKDADYEVDHTTLHVGTIRGGTALNIVPKDCVLDLEIRHLPAEPAGPLVARLADEARAIEAAAKARFPEAGISLETLSGYPGLDTPPAAEVVAFVKALTGGNSHGKISFGTEGGLFTENLGIPTVVCGPGSIVQAHKPDEYVSASQLAECDRFLSALLGYLRR
ncbi:acetylornithine deacetylase [Oleomonas cavernae]|uniref:Acetylornithine deacetylase n=1 Tax=Oleomonas cavernae TaxID=2320859 RepID=A0A418W9G8_9PROT|nr:acetylornithine deacetylase [Oleomonas cavernae]RJF86657.1 acetylornithine deacetylase [Oleomonas cavernae]